MDTTAYYNSTIFAQSAFLVALMILLLYFIKGKQTKISYRYIATLIILFILIVFEAISPYFIVNMDKHEKLYEYLCRFYIALLNIFKIQTFMIVNMACSKNGKEFNGSKIAKYAVYILGYSLITILSLSLPISYQQGGGKPYVIRGFLVLFSNIVAAIVAAVELYLLLKSKRKNNMDALYPFSICFILYIVLTIFQMVNNYYINIAAIFCTSELLIAYLTFENQDYKIYDIAKNKKHNIELQSMRKNKELNDIYFDIRSEVSTILDYSKIVENQTDAPKEVVEEAIKGIGNSTKKLTDITNTIKEGDSNVI